MNEWIQTLTFSKLLLQPSEDDNNNHPFVGKTIYEISHVKKHRIPHVMYTKVFNDKNKLSSLSYQLHGVEALYIKFLSLRSNPF